MQKMKLTQTVQKGGCAAKVEAAELRKILSQVQFPPRSENLLVDGGLFDDAAIFKINESLAMVQTLDFFTPILDDPKIFGAVAATNAISDVYAMGGRPQTAMAILAFPLATMDSEVIVEVLQGASDKMAEAGISFVGGHSIDDDTLKFGLSVTGYVHPEKVWSNSKAKSGQKLILTKALGTGTLTAALKRQVVEQNDIQEAIDSMAQLNNIIDELNGKEIEAIKAATDITGFGLIGHSMQMAKASQVRLRIQLSQLPYFEQVPEFFKKAYLTKAHRTNKAYGSENTNVLSLDEQSSLLICDPQTSGGLLLAVDGDAADSICDTLKKKNKYVRIIGEVLPLDESEKSKVVEFC